jgi:hypothetical protein
LVNRRDHVAPSAADVSGYALCCITTSAVADFRCGPLLAYYTVKDNIYQGAALAVGSLPYSIHRANVLTLRLLAMQEATTLPHQAYLSASTSTHLQATTTLHCLNPKSSFTSRRPSRRRRSISTKIPAANPLALSSGSSWNSLYMIWR